MRFTGESLDACEAPQSVFIDPKDNIWYVDVGTNLIVKTGQQTRLRMVLGEKLETRTRETRLVEHGAPGSNQMIWIADGAVISGSGSR